MLLGIEVKAEKLLEELDNGVLLCQLIDVLQNMVKACSSEERGVSDASQHTCQILIQVIPS
jgi:hypothetical protein